MITGRKGNMKMSMMNMEERKRIINCWLMEIVKKKDDRFSRIKYVNQTIFTLNRKLKVLSYFKNPEYRIPHQKTPKSIDIN